MALELTGKVKYARRMKGTAKGSGKPYDFLSFIVLDTDEGERVPLQMTEDNPQFAEICGHLEKNEKSLEDRPVKVVIRRFVPGTKKDKDTGKESPTVRFFVKSMLFSTAPAGVPGSNGR